MFRNYFFGTYLCCHIKWNRLFKPWRHHHTRRVIFHITKRTWYNIAYAVNHSHIERSIVVQMNGNCLFRNKFWFCCHNGPACSWLRHFINGTFFFKISVHIRNDNGIHKPFDKSRLSRSDRTDYTNIYTAFCTFGNVSINWISHFYTPHFPSKSIW